jgi:UrcA family protein
MAFLRFIASFHATSRANASVQSGIYPCVHGKNVSLPHPEGGLMKSTATCHTLIGIAALAAVATANLATATPKADEPRSTVVHYADLDLTRPEDARQLYRRIKRAARTVCDNYPSSDIERLKEYGNCLGQAMTAAVEKVQSEQVTAIHRAHKQRLVRKNAQQSAQGRLSPPSRRL